MPVPTTYPGVYIQEIPSGVHTITGVSTALTAFVGRAVRGPVNESTLIGSFADYGRIFGGLSEDSSMSYAVNDFFRNGGGQAVIVRVYAAPQTVDANGTPVVDSKGNPTLASGIATITLAPPPPKTKSAATSSTGGGAVPPVAQPVATPAASGFEVSALNPGTWANDSLTVTADFPTFSTAVAADVAKRYGVPATDLFNLTVTLTSPNGTQQFERFMNVSVNPKAGSRRLDRVLDNESNFIQYGAPTMQPSTATVGAAPAPNVLTAPTSKPKDGETGAGTGGLDSNALAAADYVPTTSGAKTGIHALDSFDLFNLLVIPPDTADITTALVEAILAEAIPYCAKRRAFMVVDPHPTWQGEYDTNKITSMLPTDFGSFGVYGRNGGVFFPQIIQPDPLLNSQLRAFPPSGAVAGMMARTDATRGVWKAPAGITDGALVGVDALTATLNDDDSGTLNPVGINCLRSFRAVGNVVWGSRTLSGSDQLADDYKYIPVRRLALYLEESLYRGTKWAVFEPNDEPLWAQLRLSIGGFMNELYRRGAFQGSSAKDAYYVLCDKNTTTQNDIDLGTVNVTIGFAPLKPAEFVVLSFQQIAGQLQT